MKRWDRVKWAFREAFRQETEGSKDAAIRRLKLVLVSDRTQVSPHLLEGLKKDLIKVLSKYMEVDSHRLEINIEKEENDVAITASLPVKKVSRSVKSGDEEKERAENLHKEEHNQ